MQQLTSYKLVKGSDGSLTKIVNWQEVAPRIEVTSYGHIRFYDKLVCGIHDCKKVYVPTQGEHLEVTGIDDLAAEEFQKFREFTRKFI